MKELNACGLNCPMTLLKAKQALNQIQSGEQLLVLATDKGSWRDFEVYTQQSGHELLERRSDNGVYRYIIRKK